MEQRQPSSHEMRARMGFAGSIVIGLGIAAALWSATHNMGVTVGVAVAITIALMVAFTGAFRKRGPRPPHDDAQDAEDPGPSA
ncbi:hypothetical protein ACFVAE_15010 [Microbacterium sp. NPDC057659]|uniref:hypothetical protein n=1 Tax=Microbacterium sp. NPDC057659 TaxID=3346198 RepID=UPI0036727394